MLHSDDEVHRSLAISFMNFAAQENIEVVVQDFVSGTLLDPVC
jgi:hypothetical protein